MDKKTIISIFLIVIGVTGLVLWSKSVDTKELDAREARKSSLVIEEKLSLSEKLYDFGSISMKNGNVSTVFTVTNISDKDIKIPSLYTSCMCTQAYVLKQDGTKKGPYGMPGHGGVVPKVNEILRPREALQIEVVYDPNAHGPAGVGLIERAVILEDENKNMVEFIFRASVTP